VALVIRKLVHWLDETLIEGGKTAAVPHKLAAVAAVIRNPWAGQGFVEDLDPAILEIASPLGEVMVPRLMSLAGGADQVEAYGKAAVVGVNGEIEHGCAVIHTLRFGNWLREAVGGSQFIPSTNKRGGANASVTMPLKHINKEGARSHFLSLEFAIPDAPAADEIVVALGVATTGRPHARIGDRYQDMQILGVDQTNKKMG
jgi:hypothetical protein